MLRQKIEKALQQSGDEWLKPKSEEPGVEKRKGGDEEDDEKQVDKGQGGFHQLVAPQPIKT